MTRTSRRPKTAGADMAPVYTARPGVSVDLSFPFKIGSDEYAKVDLVPPTLADLEAIRAAEAITARLLLAPLTGLPERAQSALRWPDVEKILTAALPLLPPDIRAILERGPEPEPNAAPIVDVPEEVAVPGDPDPADASEWVGPDERPGDPSDFLFRTDDLIKLGRQ